MNELVLDLLMQLFARIARLDGLEREEVRITEEYLQTILPADLATTYINRFQQHVLEAQENPHIAQLCERINRDLTVQQKFYLYIRLLELIAADGQISAGEQEAIDSVAIGLNMDAYEAESVYEFVLADKPRQLLLRNLCIISSGIGSPRGVHLEVPGLVGYIAVLQLEKADLYVLRYIGNGEVLLGGQQLQPSRVAIFNPGGVIRSSRTQPVYFSEVATLFYTPRQPHTLVFEANDVAYRFPSGHIGMHPLDIRESSGKMIALMGGSGAGKSTLLNVLNGNLRPSQGQVLLNGVDLHSRDERLQGLIGYVSQSDLLLEDLTVRENLHYNARLCFANLPPAEIERRVDAILADLGLQDTAHLRVGTPLNKLISGGQRKRLNIALELIREPAVLFVDEPTSGLSSRDSEQVMDLLKERAQRGTLVFVVIHQPSSDIYKLFDKLYLLDTGGYLIYAGNPLEAVRYFRRAMHYAHSDDAACDTCGTVNPEQIFNIVDTRVVDEIGNPTRIRKMTPANWYQLFRTQAQQPVAVAAQPVLTAPAPTLKAKVPGMEPVPPVQPDGGNPPPLPESQLHVPGILRQLGIFFSRDLRGKLRDTSYLLINILEAPVLAFVLAYLYRFFDASSTETYTLYGNRNLPAYLFTSVLVALFIGLTVSAEEILKDRRIRTREAFLHLSRNSYLLAKVALLFGLAALQALLYVLVGNAVLQIPMEMLPWHWGMLFSAICVGNLLGLNISSAFDNAVTIYILVPVLLIPQMVLSGAMLPFHELNPSVAPTDSPPIVANLMASRWAYEGLTVQQFMGNRYGQAVYPSEQQMHQARYRLDDWLPALQAKLDRAANIAGTETSRRDLAYVRTELSANIGKATPAQQAALQRMVLGKADDQTLKGARSLFAALQTYWQRKLAQSRIARDAILAQLPDAETLRTTHHNARLEELLSDRIATEHVVWDDDRLRQLNDPVYRLPNSLWDAHFQAPAKPVLGIVVKTYWTNLLVLWLMVAVLYGLLYADALRRAVTGFGELRLRFQR